MTLREAIASLRHRLETAAIADAGLEAEVLLMHAAGLTRAELYARLGDGLPAPAGERLGQLAARRLTHEPLAYITGHREFFSLDFLVDRRVMVPRQETETLVEEALAIAREFPEGRCAIADVGAGSGCIAVSLAVHLPQAVIYAIDSDATALEAAAVNAQRHGVADRIRFLHGDLLAPLREPVHIVVANLPYVPDAEWPGLQPEICRYEPKQALVPGPTGLEANLRLLEQAAALRDGPRWLLLEAGNGQPPLLAQEARRLLPKAGVRIYRDLAGLERGLVISLAGRA